MLAALTLACALAGQPVRAAADDAATDIAGLGIRFTGFGTLGLAHHGNRDVGVITSFSQVRPAAAGWSGNLDSVMGLQADARLGATTLATLQGVVRGGDDFHPRLRMAYVRQQIGRDLALRLGRLRSPVFLDSDVNEIGFAYPTVRPSMPLYGSAAANFNHIDGADLQWREGLGNSALLLQAFAGRGAYRHMFYDQPGVPQGRGTFDGARGLALSLALPDAMLRASRTWIRRFDLRTDQTDQLDAGLQAIAGGLTQTAANPLLPAPVAGGLLAKAAAVQGYTGLFAARPIYTSLGGDASLGDWRLQGEWAEFDSRSEMIGRYRGWTATLGHAMGSVTPYVSLTHNSRQTPLLDTAGLAPTGADAGLDAALTGVRAQLDGAAELTDLSARSAAVGLRWDWRDSCVFKLQYEHLRSRSARAPGVYAVRALPINPEVRLLSLTLDFVF
ncbi:MAG: hypothetical protein RIQ60_2897 [Pseudomonadota bacterium]|jgi:hypothetical protein